MKTPTQKGAVFVGRGAAVHFAALGVSNLCQFALTIGLTRRQGFDDLGLYSIALGIVLLVSVATRLGLDFAAMHLVSVARSRHDPESASRVGWQSIFLAGAGGLAGAAALALAAPWVAASLRMPGLARLLMALALVVPFANVAYAAAGALRGAGRPRASVVGIALPPLLSLVGAAVVLLSGGGTTDVALTTMAAFGVAAACTVALGIHELGRPRLAGDGRSLVRLGATNALVQLSNYVIVWMGVFALAVFSTDKDVGYFRAASQFALLVTMPVEGLGAFFAPLSSRLLARGHLDELSDVAKSTARIAFMPSGIAAIAVTLAPHAVLLPFGPWVGPALPPLLVLAIAHAVASLLGPSSWVLLTGDRASSSVLAKAPALVLGALAAWLLVPPLGILGAALATAIAILVRAASHYAFIRRAVSVQTFSKPLFLAFALFVAVIATGSTIIAWRPAYEPVVAAVGLAAFAGGAWRFGLTPVDRASLVAILAIARRPLRGPIEAPGPREVERAE